MSDRRGLLVARDTEYRDFTPEKVGARHTVVACAVAYLGQHLHRNIEQFADGRGPTALFDVVEHCPTCVCGVGRVHRAPGKAPDDVRVHCTEEQIAIARALSRPFVLIQNPFQLGRREIGIKEKACLGRDRLFIASLAHLGAIVSRTAILPDDRVVERFPSRLFPDQRRFPLVRNADGSNVL